MTQDEILQSISRSGAQLTPEIMEGAYEFTSTGTNYQFAADWWKALKNIPGAFDLWDEFCACKEAQAEPEPAEEVTEENTESAGESQRVVCDNGNR